MIVERNFWSVGQNYLFAARAELPDWVSGTKALGPLPPGLSDKAADVACVASGNHAMTSYAGDDLAKRLLREDDAFAPRSAGALARPVPRTQGDAPSDTPKNPAQACSDRCDVVGDRCATNCTNDLLATHAPVTDVFYQCQDACSARNERCTDQCRSDHRVAPANGVTPANHERGKPARMREPAGIGDASPETSASVTTSGDSGTGTCRNTTLQQRQDPHVCSQGSPADAMGRTASGATNARRAGTRARRSRTRLGFVARTSNEHVERTLRVSGARAAAAGRLDAIGLTAKRPSDVLSARGREGKRDGLAGSGASPVRCSSPFLAAASERRRPPRCPSRRSCSRPPTRSRSSRACRRARVQTAGNAEAARKEVLAELAERMASGQLEIPIARTYPLDQVQDAYRELEQRHTLGQIVLIP